MVLVAVPEDTNVKYGQLDKSRGWDEKSNKNGQWEDYSWEPGIFENIIRPLINVIIGLIPGPWGMLTGYSEAVNQATDRDLFEQAPKGPEFSNPNDKDVSVIVWDVPSWDGLVKLRIDVPVTHGANTDISFFVKGVSEVATNDAQRSFAAVYAAEYRMP